MKSHLALAGLSLFSTMTFAQSILSKHDQKLELEFKSILETIENNYGPLRLKKMTVGLDWDKSKAEYLQSLKSVKNTTQYFALISKVFGDLKDAHVSINLPSTLSLTYPFQFIYAEDKTLIGAIGEDVKDCTAGPGDELIAINNKSPEELREILARYEGMGNNLADKSYLTLRLSSISEARGFPVALFDAPMESFTFKTEKTGAVIECLMDIKPKGVGIVERGFHGGEGVISAPSVASSFEKELESISKDVKIPQADIAKLKKYNEIVLKLDQLINLRFNKNEKFFISGKEKGKRIELGDKKPFFKLPKNFKRIRPIGLLSGILNSSNFYAGTFKRNGKTIGYLRIPSYMPESPIFMLFSIRYYIQKLEKKSDLLIIDQTNNPGGMVAFSDMIVSNLVRKVDDEVHMGFRVRPTQNFLRTFLTLKESIQNDKEIKQYFKDKYLPKIDQEFKKVYDAYISGAELSEPISLRLISDFLEDALSDILRNVETGKITTLGSIVEGITFLKDVDLSKRIPYSKPIFMWINELDFSGGDATPAVLQDYKRVTLVGTNTAGAGGSVEPFQQSVLHPISFNLTTSLMFRPNHTNQYVENYGVAPDIEFDKTIEDVRDGYSTLFEKFLQKINL